MDLVPQERRKQRVRYFGEPLLIGIDKLKEYIG
jgi:hypothetical protein